MALIVKAWPVLASVALLLAGFPPSPLGLLALVALAPWFANLAKCTPKESVKSGYLFGFLYMGAQMAWLQTLIYRWTGNLFLSIFPVVLAALVAAWYFAFAGWLINACWRWKQPWMIALVWAGIEVIRSYFPVVAFPWGLAATPLYAHPYLIQSAFYGTIYFVSAWVAFINVIFAMFLSGEQHQKLRPLAAIAIVIGLASALRYQDKPTGEQKEFLIGQPGVDMAFTPLEEQPALIQRKVDSILARSILKPVTFTLLPEGLVPASDHIPPPTPFTVVTGMPMLFGGQRVEGESTFQTAYGYDGQWKTADKRRLVIFGEFVPGRSWLPFLKSFHLAASDLSAAKTTSAIDLNGVRVGPMLCFEGLFYQISEAQVANGAQMLAIMSLDDWYMGTEAPSQLKSAAVFRAVETGLPTLRAGSLGYSLAADQRGNIVAEAPLGQTAELPVKMTVPSEPEPAKARPFVPWALVGSCLVGLFFAVKKPSGLSDKSDRSETPDQSNKNMARKKRK